MTLFNEMFIFTVLRCNYAPNFTHYCSLFYYYISNQPKIQYVIFSFEKMGIN